MCFVHIWIFSDHCVYFHDASIEITRRGDCWKKRQKTGYIGGLDPGRVHSRGTAAKGDQNDEAFMAPLKKANSTIPYFKKAVNQR